MLVSGVVGRIQAEVMVAAASKFITKVLFMISMQILRLLYLSSFITMGEKVRLSIP